MNSGSPKSGSVDVALTLRDGGDGHTGAFVRAVVAAGARWAAILVAESGMPAWRLRQVAPALQDDRTGALRPLLRAVDRVAVMRGAVRGRSRTMLSRLHGGPEGGAVLAVNWLAESAPSTAAARVLSTAAAFAWAADETADELRALRCALDAAARNEHALGAVAREAATLAHDFNNALTSILGFSEWLLCEEDVAQRARTELTHIRDSAVAASDIVARLQSLVRPYRKLGAHSSARQADPPGAAHGAASPPGLAPIASAPLSILVVDDERDVCETVAAMLRGLGYDVSPVTSGDVAMHVAATRSFDAVLTDLSMPEMSGLELARRMGAQYPETRVIVMTGWGAGGETDAAEGVSLVIGKPVTLDSLRQALAFVLGRAA